MYTARGIQGESDNTPQYPPKFYSESSQYGLESSDQNQIASSPQPGTLAFCPLRPILPILVHSERSEQKQHYRAPFGGLQGPWYPKAVHASTIEETSGPLSSGLRYQGFVYGLGAGVCLFGVRESNFTKK